MRRCWALVGLVGLLLAQSASSQGYMSGVLLHKLCTSSAPKDKDTCHAYILGVIDTVVAEEKELKRNLVCMPPALDAQKAVDVAIRYLQQNPAERPYVAATTVSVALFEAYPCRKR